MNTFSSTILTCVSLPLLLYWPLSGAKIINFWMKTNKKAEKEDEKGEFELQEDHNVLKSNLAKYFFCFLIIVGLKVGD